MNIFAHKTDKGKFNLGNEADLNGIADGTAFNSIKALAGMITGIENGATASKTYNAGEYIIRNGSLYRVTTTIASGTVITIGVNIEEATIGGELNEINDLIPSAASVSNKLATNNDIPTVSVASSLTYGSNVNPMNVRLQKFGRVCQFDMQFTFKSNQAAGQVVIATVPTAFKCGNYLPFGIAYLTVVDKCASIFMSASTGEIIFYTAGGFNANTEIRATMTYFSAT